MKVVIQHECKQLLPRVSGHVCGCEEIERETYFEEKNEHDGRTEGQVQTTDCSSTGPFLAAFFGGDFVFHAV